LKLEQFKPSLAILLDVCRLQNVHFEDGVQEAATGTEDVSGNIFGVNEASATTGVIISGALRQNATSSASVML
jgi:hypothetical protein